MGVWVCGCVCRCGFLGGYEEVWVLYQVAGDDGGVVNETHTYTHTHTHLHTHTHTPDESAEQTPLGHQNTDWREDLLDVHWLLLARL